MPARARKISEKRRLENQQDYGIPPKVFEELMDESYAVILDHIRPDIPVPGAALCIIQATDLDSITQRVPQANAGLHFTLPEWD
ncbi:hypothetical protein H112_05826 [Trichophyton rubrum D6]|uniref:Uncharacterized protein n=3 Tax=Trichophyton TaxID=5550 RepID=F2SKK0_TRIRC|nr:uncharacterized protein TERG_08784 [Trichophyton rubrum CBS 118892]EZF15984.1 hypothetical protein H100_05840 [Trichophyton rubrum MR850]EZF40113.1 hypothetical protein H102_05809 [Trichophyton rubrum CBS 100081]EZF50738.1 hypothetical protein H103_05837 [Trichophyton rubrum CBS 288.86]EZF61343.1 hypothetical protein H104_05823 [Trichophyton rubrum CBS 289.86]EZF71996.1 hypothetical protein H105_05850 [Trichophyton soudanense CBS 452.61]EZF82650.1 hypothetical protein H110_05831 [Trichophy